MTLQRWVCFSVGVEEEVEMFPYAGVRHVSFVRRVKRSVLSFRFSCCQISGSVSFPKDRDVQMCSQDVSVFASNTIRLRSCLPVCELFSSGGRVREGGREGGKVHESNNIFRFLGLQLNGIADCGRYHDEFNRFRVLFFRCPA